MPASKLWWFLFFVYIIAIVMSNTMDSGAFISGVAANETMFPTAAVNGTDHLTELVRGLPMVELEVTHAGPQLTANALDWNPVTNSRKFFSGLWGILSWDSAYFEGTLFGFPLSFLRTLGFAFSMGIIIPIALAMINAAKSLVSVIPGVSN